MYVQTGRARLSHQISRIHCLMSILAWSAFLTLVKPFVATRCLIRLALPVAKPGPRDDYSYEQAHCLLCWFNEARWLNRRNCMLRALVTCRVFRLVGEEPTLVIGSDGQTGHAWVEIDNQIICESPDRIRLFRPVFVVKPNSHQLEIADRH